MLPTTRRSPTPSPNTFLFQNPPFLSQTTRPFPLMCSNYCGPTTAAPKTPALPPPRSPNPPYPGSKPPGPPLWSPNTVAPTTAAPPIGSPKNRAPQLVHPKPPAPIPTLLPNKTPAQNRRFQICIPTLPQILGSPTTASPLLCSK
ncbi:hypothetical protein PBY51_022249 [Eleginops maclovinus]|uniref:Uncharacterized protein n=1 Tax=Eleginops maclovinus TaxID=56733 RepID=A0AAN7XGN9_ELEMC|nr:hypothetical protein PBY51_022249 [Eleginops maclovinus]